MKVELIKNATLTSYGKASELAGHKVSRQTVHNLVKKTQTVDTPCSGARRSVENIYIEADEDHIHLQNGKCAEVKLVYVHEGVSKVCKGRTKLKNTRYFVSAEDDPDKIWNDVAHYLYKTYASLAKSKVHISGDGAYWIKYAMQIIPNAEYHIDRFHINKSATIIAKGNKSIKRQLLKSMRAKDVDTIKKLYYVQYQNYAQLSEKKTISSNCFYLLNNVEFYNIQNRCSAEGHVSHVLSSRMSSRPMGWSIFGAEKIAQLRAYYYNDGDFSKLVSRKVRTQEKINSMPGLPVNNTVVTAQGGINGYVEPMHLVGLDGITDRISLKLRKILNY